MRLHKALLVVCTRPRTKNATMAQTFSLRLSGNWQVCKSSDPLESPLVKVFTERRVLYHFSKTILHWHGSFVTTTSILKPHTTRASQCSHLKRDEIVFAQFGTISFISLSSQKLCLLYWLKPFFLFSLILSIFSCSAKSLLVAPSFSPWHRYPSLSHSFFPFLGQHSASVANCFELVSKTISATTKLKNDQSYVRQSNTLTT